MAPVSGLVTFGSEPVQHALVTFFPQGVPDGKIGFARTDEEGRFDAVTTFAANDGVVVGEHLATVTEGWPPGVDIPLDDSGMQKSPPRGPWRPEYRDSVSTPLAFTVVEGQQNHFEIDLSN